MDSTACARYDRTGSTCSPVVSHACNPNPSKNTTPPIALNSANRDPSKTLGSTDCLGAAGRPRDLAVGRDPENCSATRSPTRRTPAKSGTTTAGNGSVATSCPEPAQSCCVVIVAYSAYPRLWESVGKPAGARTSSRSPRNLRSAHQAVPANTARPDLSTDVAYVLPKGIDGSYHWL